MQQQQHLHPVHAYQKGVIVTSTGFEVDLQSPLPHDIQINDIANALSKICRFGGQTNSFYSVAQHSVLVAALAPDHLKKEALLHDAAEAYIGDVIKPLKHLLKNYSLVETNFNFAISGAFGIDLMASAPLIKPYDMLALEMEHEALQFNNPGRLIIEMKKQELDTDDRWAWSHDFARRVFKACYHDYFNL